MIVWTSERLNPSSIGVDGGLFATILTDENDIVFNQLRRNPLPTQERLVRFFLDNYSHLDKLGDDLIKDTEAVFNDVSSYAIMAMSNLIYHQTRHGHLPNNYGKRLLDVLDFSN